MSRLPIPGSDKGTWGDILNDYLTTAHNPDGSLKSSALRILDSSITTPQLADNAVTDSKLDVATQTTLSTVASKYTKPGSGIPTTDLTTAIQTSLGKADTALQAAPVTSVAGKTGAVSLAKADVGLTNVDDTSDTNKPISSATQTALNAKATDSSVVHLAGTETITGAKDFTGGATISGTNIVVTSDTRLTDQRVPTDGSVTTAKIASGGIAESAVTNLTTDLSGKLTASNNLSDLSSTSTALSNLGAAPGLTTTVVKTTTYVATANQLVPADATSAAFTVTLPTAPADKTRVLVKKIDTSANTVTIATAGSDIFNKAGGSTSVSLSLQNQAVTVQYNSSTSIWYVVSDDVPLTALDSTYAARRMALAPTSSRAEPVTTMVSNASVSGHGWVAGGGNNAGTVLNLNDTTPGMIGTQSVKITTNGTGGNGRIDKAGLTIDMTGKDLVLWLTVDDPTKLLSILLYLADTNLMANFWIWEVQASFDMFFEAGVPTKITIPFTNNFGVTGSPSRSSLGYARLHVVDKSTGPVTVRFSGLGAQLEPAAGACVFCWDDSYATQVTSQAILDRYAMPSTYYTIAEAVGSGGLTLAQLQGFQAAGCEIASHSFTYAAHNASGGFTSLTSNQLEAEYISLKEWMTTNGFWGADNLAYPQGAYNATVLAMTKRYFSSARTTIQRGKETLPPADRHKIRARGLDSGTTLAVAKLYVDVAVASHSLIVFVGHKIGATADSITWVTSDLTALTDYIAASGLTVKTMTSALR